MFEKLASSEIAQSQGFGENCMCDSPEFPHESPEFVRTWRKAGCSACARNPKRICDQCQERIAVASAATQRAERDTRERCAQQVSEIKPIPELIPADPDEGHTYKVGFFDALRSGAERIRGKE